MGKGNGSAGRAGGGVPAASAAKNAPEVDKYAMSESERAAEIAFAAQHSADFKKAMEQVKGKEGPLTREEAASIYEYTDYGSWDRSDKILKGENLSSSERALVATMDKALAKLPDTKSTTYRGLGMTDSELAALKPGGTWKSPNYMSSSFSANWSKHFADERADGNHKVVLRIKGGAKDISRWSRYGTEREALVPRNKSYKIKAVTSRGGFTYVDLER